MPRLPLECVDLANAQATGMYVLLFAWFELDFEAI